MKSKKDEILSIIEREDPKELRALFGFNRENTVREIVLKFNLWARKYFVRFFSSEDAAFHDDIDTYNVRAYRGDISSFLNIMFRGGSKTTRTKLFLAFCIANDEEHARKYIKILSREGTNSTQFVTDIYNMLVSPQVVALYPEIFQKTHAKREETMGSFTTASGVKVAAGTIGQSQRGAIQDESRPDVIVFDDIEDRVSLRSAVITKAIWDNMEEAKNSLSMNGAAIYLANYISEMGNIHKLVGRVEHKIIIPIENGGTPTWPERYSQESVDAFRKSADDFEGEYLCKPNASRDVYFDRERLDAMEVRQPVETIAGFKIYRKYDPAHRYASGHDIAGGVGLDSSTSVFIDFSTVPAQVVATFASNTIAPESFGDEIYSEAKRFGNCLVAPENNRYDQAILKAKQLGANLHRSIKGATLKTLSVSQPTFVYGWGTSALTKSNMLNDLRAALNDGLLVLNDGDLINEARSYTRNDLIDREPDARLVTRHFDLLTACAIAWQMKDIASVKEHDPIPMLSIQGDINPAL